jgi:hypothetical protein
MNYYDSTNISANTLFETQELDLKPVPPDSYGHGYNFRQEIAVFVDGKLLIDPVNGSHNFKFKMNW